MCIGTGDLVAAGTGSIPFHTVPDEHLNRSFVVMPYYPNIKSLVVVFVEPLDRMGLVQRTIEPSRLVTHDHLIWLPLHSNIQPSLSRGVTELVVGHHLGQIVHTSHLCCPGIVVSRYHRQYLAFLVLAIPE